MKRAYTRLSPARKLAMRIAHTAVPSIGTRHLAELFGISHQQLYNAVGDAKPLGLIESLSSLRSGWVADNGQPDTSDWLPALFEAIAIAFVMTAYAVPGDRRPKGLIVPPEEVQKLVRHYQVNPDAAQSTLTRTIIRFEAQFDSLNRMIGCYRRSAGRRAA